MPTDRKELLSNALLAWQMAIETLIKNPETLRPIGSLANDFGNSITTPECLDEVADWFKWNKIAKELGV